MRIYLLTSVAGATTFGLSLIGVQELVANKRAWASAATKRVSSRVNQLHEASKQ